MHEDCGHQNNKKDPVQLQLWCEEHTKNVRSYSLKILNCLLLHAK